MSDVTRRELLQRLAAAIAAAGALDPVAAREAHLAVQQAAAGGKYAPKALSGHEFRTLERLTDLIVPAEESRPGTGERAFGGGGMMAGGGGLLLGSFAAAFVGSTIATASPKH